MRFFRKGWIFLCGSILAAQGFRATIVGRVTDDSGAVVPGAKVSITNTGTNESRAVVVGADGEYLIP
jgi:Carboxypeptidase regulatory-like domain